MRSSHNSNPCHSGSSSRSERNKNKVRINPILHNCEQHAAHPQIERSRKEFKQGKLDSPLGMGRGLAKGSGGGVGLNFLACGQLLKYKLHLMG